MTKYSSKMYNTVVVTTDIQEEYTSTKLVIM